jgi:uncharacterized protein (TIGR02231 family)
MKLPVIALTLFCLSGMARAGEIDAPSKITAVTVFPDRANVSRTAEISLPAGKTTLLFDGLPAGILPDSIRVAGKGTGAFSIGSVETKQMYSDKLVVAGEKELDDKITALQDKRLFLEAELKALETGEAFIREVSYNPNGAPTPNTEKAVPNPDSWQKALTVIQNSMNTMGKDKIEKQIALRGLDMELNALRLKKRSIATGRKSWKQIRVNVETKRPGTARLTLQYQMFGASWQPLYEARLDSGQETVKIIQYGNIAQKTGEDWTNVALTLSTAVPSVNTTPPVLTPKWLDLAAPAEKPVHFLREKKALGGTSAQLTNFAAPQQLQKLDSFEAEVMQDAVMETASVTATEFSGVFEIRGTANVPADGAEYRFTVGEYVSPAEIRAETMPALDASAYLIATLIFKGELPLLPGNVSLFRDDDFIGSSYIDLLRPNEKLHLSFGPDEKIRVKYTVLGGEKTEGGVLNRDVKIEALSRAEVQNLHKTPLKIAVYDSLPVARDSGISVKVIKDRTTPDYVLDPNNKVGTVMWESLYAPSEKKTIDFGYAVIYPKDRILTGL